MNASVLIVDDEPVFRAMAEDALSTEGFTVRSAPTLSRARRELASFGPDVVLLDRRLPDGDGLELLELVRAEGPAAPIVVIATAHGEVENAVTALQAGAWDYLTKPVQLTDLVIKLRKVLETRDLRDRLHLARNGASRPPPIAPRSRAMTAALQALRRVSVSPHTPVLIQGPSGAGKQYAAEMLHAATVEGGDREAPFVEVNCAALPPDLVESELFGHEKGAFTGARSAKRGLVEIADGGTLFLDELTTLPLHVQAKLLKFLDGLTFRRVGGTREIAVRLRVVAATNQDVLEQVRAGAFREDLYHRLAVFHVRLPALRECPEDIPVLAAGFVRHFAGVLNKRVEGLAPAALDALCAYDFPGNVRELRNVIERSVILARGPWITEGELLLPAGASPLKRGGAPAFFSVPLRADGGVPTLLEVERRYVAAVLEQCGGRRTVAAEALGISYPTFLRRLRELDLEDDDEPADA